MKIKASFGNVGKSGRDFPQWKIIDLSSSRIIVRFPHLLLLATSNFMMLFPQPPLIPLSPESLKDQFAKYENQEGALAAIFIFVKKIMMKI